MALPAMFKQMVGFFPLTSYMFTQFHESVRVKVIFVYFCIVELTKLLPSLFVLTQGDTKCPATRVSQLSLRTWLPNAQKIFTPISHVNV
jgi:hypothetical protein